MKRIAICSIILALGCGSNQEETKSIPQPLPAETAPITETPYGDAVQIKSYLEAINPFIQEIGKIHLEVNKKIGTSGKATGENLAAAMTKVKPRLIKAIDDFSQIEPPPLLATLHADIKKLMLLRKEGYEQTIRGRALEVSEGNTSTYEVAEKTLKEANQLILKLNQEMSELNKAMEQISEATQTAAP